MSVHSNGPATVTYHVEIYNSENTLLNHISDTTLTFASYSTQTFDPTGGPFLVPPCNNFYIMAVVTSPNKASARADWSLVNP
jgi:hypothetical protein